MGYLANYHCRKLALSPTRTFRGILWNTLLKDGWEWEGLWANPSLFGWEKSSGSFITLPQLCMWQGSDTEALRKAKKPGGEHLMGGILQLATYAAAAKPSPGHVAKVLLWLKDDRLGSRVVFLFPLVYMITNLKLCLKLALGIWFSGRTGDYYVESSRLDLHHCQT